jgi:hypothetical protein
LQDARRRRGLTDCRNPGAVGRHLRLSCASFSGRQRTIDCGRSSTLHSFSSIRDLIRADWLANYTLIRSGNRLGTRRSLRPLIRKHNAAYMLLRNSRINAFFYGSRLVIHRQSYSFNRGATPQSDQAA